MKLTAEQIERLYAFTRQHYVEYYDLQTELVDHLANAIEQQWEQNPRLSFEEALSAEFRKFGVFGFMEVVDKRRGALSSKYSKLVWQQLKTFFTIPKIIGTFSAMGIMFYLLKYFQQGEDLVLMLFIALIVVFVIGLKILSHKNKRLNRKTEKKWLLKEMIFGYSSVTGFIYLPLQVSFHLCGRHYNDYTLALFSIFFVASCLIVYIVLILIPSKADEYLKETYPEYALVENM